MTPRPKVIPASHLAADPEIAAFMFENAVIDESGDPLAILMQREAEGEFTFHEEDGVQYPFFEQGDAMEH